MRKAIPLVCALSFLFCAAPYALAGTLTGSADIVLGQGSFTQTLKNSPDEYGFNAPNGVAIDTTTGRVYIADTTNHRVLFWNSKGSLLNGAGADGWLGQPTFFSTGTNRTGANASPADNSFSSPRYLAVDPAGNLWVSDSGNSRVLKFNYPVTNDQHASLVLGQAGFVTGTANPGGRGAWNLSTPYGLTMDAGGTLWVADYGNHRVLGFTDFSQNGTSATVVLGQADFAAGTANRGLTVSTNTLNRPWGITVDSSNNVWVSDSSNNRVLRYGIPVVNGMDADLVLGQANFFTATPNAGGRSASSLSAPYGLFVVSTDTVFVADRNNHRVLKYSLSVSTVAATMALGQQNFNFGTANDNNGDGTADSVGETTLNVPYDAAVDENNDVWVVDSTNYRVLKYANPSATGAGASLVLGQGDFTHNVLNCVDHRGFSNYVSGVAYDASSGRIYVADNANHRVLWWDNYNDLITHAPAAGVLGQHDFFSNKYNRTNTAANAYADSLYLDFGGVMMCGIAVDSHGTVWVADSYNNRVLGYYAPVATGKDADVVIGQANTSGNAQNQGGAAGPNTLDSPAGIALDGADNLWVAEYSNSRVLRFDYPQSTNMNASKVLGQADFNGNSINRGGTAKANTLNAPDDVKVDASGNVVWVADTANHRVLKYDLTVSSSDAVLALGQADLTSNTQNRGANPANAGTMNKPQGINIDGATVWVADTNNYRILRFDSPSASGVNANGLLGQDVFTSTRTNRGGTPNSNTFNKPWGLAIDGRHNVWIADLSNSRVLKYNNFSITSITPDKGANTLPVNITNLAGGDLQSTYEVKLQKTGESDITATGVSAPSSQQITCTFDLTGKATGYWDVKVSTSPGYLSATLPAAFEILPMTVTSITPASAGNLGTVSITNLAGYGFLAGSQVTLKKNLQTDIVATNVTVVDSGRITCDLDLNGAQTGAWDIEVSSDARVATLSGGFTITGLSILVSTITPSFGYESGPVNITKLGGGGFAAGCEAKLAKEGQPDIAAANLNIVDASSMTCTFSLAGVTTGFWNVVVSTGGAGASSSTLAGGFEVRPMQVYVVAPSSSPNSAAVISTVTGQGFVAGSTIKLVRSGQPDIPGTGVTVYASSITCTFDITAKATGYWDVAVSTGGPGSMTRTLSNGFEVAPMQVISLDPSSSVNTINAAISAITGRGFVPGSQVKLVRTGETDIPGTGVTVYSSTAIACSFDIIGKTTGYWDLMVSTGGAGSFSCSLSSGLLILPMQVTLSTPGWGVNTGIATLTNLAGQGFVPGSQVKLQKSGQPDVPGTGMTVTASTSIISCAFDLNGIATGFWDIAVSTGGAGSISCTLADGFNVLPMQLTSITPNNGLNTGIVSFSTVTGQGFVPGSQAWLARTGEADIAGTGVVIIGTGTIVSDFDLAGAATGYWDVVVSTGGPGAMFCSLPGGFNVVSVIVNSMTPGSGFNSAPVNVTDIAGVGFTSNSEVLLAKPGQTDIPGTNVAVNASSTSIACTFDITAKATGYWDLVISTGGAGSYSFTLSNGFAVLPMQITSMAPASAANTAAVAVSTITGQGFVPGSQVKLVKDGAEIPGTGLAVYASSITCGFDIAGKTTGYWDVVVSTGGAGSFSFTLSSGLAVLPLQVAAIAPNSAVNTAAVAISSITGQGFVPGSEARLVKSGQSPIAGTGVTVVSSTMIVCSFDIAGKATGYWDVEVSTGGAGAMSAALAGGFTVLPMQIISITPDSARNSDRAYISGLLVQGLVPGTQVKLVQGAEEIPATNVGVYASSITCRFDIVGRTTGYWDVVVSTNAIICTLADGFNVLPMQITSIHTSTGVNTGTYFTLDIKGKGFLEGFKGKLKKTGQEEINAFYWDYHPETEVLTLRFNLWGAATGSWDVLVTTGDAGSFFCTLPSSFTVQSMLVSSTTPTGAVNTNNATTISVHGQGLVPGSDVQLTKDGSTPISATNVGVTFGAGIDSTLTGTFDLLNKATGYWNVVVTTGAITYTKPNAFLVNSFLVTAITPGSGYNTGPVAISALSGINFPPTSRVRLKKDGNAPIEGTNITVASSSTITCTFDLTNRTTGPWDVEVSTGVGSAATTTLVNGFTILPLQVISVTPNRAGNYGPASVTLRGDGFLSGSRVKLFKTDQPEITASNVAVVTASTITCTFNLTRKTTGTWDVMVTTGSSVDILEGSFEIFFSTENLTTVNPLAETTLTLAAESGEITIALPAGTFGEEVRMLLTEAKAPESAQKTLKVTQVCYEITNDKGLQPQKEFVLRIHYLDSDVIDLDETRLVIGRYDTSSSRWITYPSTVNPDENYVQANINHLSKFALIAQIAAADLNGVRVFPSPYSPLRHPLGLTIDNLPLEADIRLFTVTGEFICTVPYTDQSGRATWSGRNEAGQPVANGVYIALIKSPEGMRKIKIALEK